MMDADKFDQLVKALAALDYPRPVNVLPSNAPGWVGLTDEEISEVLEMGYGARASIEIALEKAEEKNA